MTNPTKIPRQILLAEDDDDDSMLFKEALNELTSQTNLNRVKDGEELMQILLNPSNAELPDMVFLDINMPRKNGFECLIEIKRIDKLKNIPVIILSTSSGKELVLKMYNAGANLYVCKPSHFGELKKIIEFSISTNWSQYFPKPPFEKFMMRV